MGKSSPSPSRKLADLKRRRRDKMLEEKSGNERFTFHANFASQQPAEGSQLNLSEESSSDDQQDEEAALAKVVDRARIERRSTGA